MTLPTLGDQELRILQYVADHAPVSVRDVATHFGAVQGLARTTILTVMERLREKGFLVRKKQAGIFVYAPTSGKTEVLQNLIHDFVQRTLGGRVAPFVAYLTETRNVSPHELEELKRLVQTLEQDSPQTEAGSRPPEQEDTP